MFSASPLEPGCAENRRAKSLRGIEGNHFALEPIPIRWNRERVPRGAYTAAPPSWPAFGCPPFDFLQREKDLRWRCGKFPAAASGVRPACLSLLPAPPAE